uniref:Polysaccharide biosynthesis protein CapD-like domain-containing protein n=1 Tax=viral metagenome TaxID=1070528 RepID=A0A6C0AQ73_9ZZZZ
MIENKTILIFGGTGSLGYEVVKRYIAKNKIYNYSRDECKHWKMKLDFNNSPNLEFIIGDVINNKKVEETLLRVKPNILIIASAMKHIDQCEYNTDQSLNTNLLGVKNILDNIELHKNDLNGFLETVLFVSSDKACSPINVYGMCKALSETLIVEKSLYIKNFKFVNIRYGNVLNSRGSIIPLLHTIGLDNKKNFFTLTNDNMTRFVMTLEQSVDLIDHTLLNGESGDTVIPKLISMKVKDLIEIFSEKYNKPIKNIGIKPGEKLLESLINKPQSARIKINGNYTHIKSIYTFNDTIDETLLNDYNSKINPLTKEELKKYLLDLDLIN